MHSVFYGFWSDVIFHKPYVQRNKESVVLTMYYNKYYCLYGFPFK